MKNIRNNKGITLIALVVTIVVLLIIVGISVKLVIGNNGIIDKTQEASNKQKESMDNDQKLSEELADQIEIETFVTDRTGIKVGDYIKYEPTVKTYNKIINGVIIPENNITTENLTWRVMNIEKDGTINLIGSVTSKKIGVNGADSYNNIVNVLDDICGTLYSNDTLGVKARSVKIEDIEKFYTEIAKTKRREYENEGVKYYQTRTYLGDINYPELYGIEKGNAIDSGKLGLENNGIDKEKVKRDGISLSEQGRGNGHKNVKSSLTATQTRYSMMITEENLGKEGYEIFKSSRSYWLSSRCIRCNYDNIFFGIRRVEAPQASTNNNNLLDAKSVYFSNNTDISSTGEKLRPIAIIKPIITIENKTGDISNPHIIK